MNFENQKYNIARSNNIVSRRLESDEAKFDPMIWFLSDRTRIENFKEQQLYNFQIKGRSAIGIIGITDVTPT